MNTRLLLTAKGVSIAVMVAGSRMPEVVHWGHELQPLTTEQFDSLALANVVQVGPNNPDTPPRFGILLEGRYGKARQFATDRPWATAAAAGVIGLAILNTLRGKGRA